MKRRIFIILAAVVVLILLYALPIPMPINRTLDGSAIDLTTAQDSFSCTIAVSGIYHNYLFENDNSRNDYLDAEITVFTPDNINSAVVFSTNSPYRYVFPKSYSTAITDSASASEPSANCRIIITKNCDNITILCNSDICGQGSAVTPDYNCLITYPMSDAASAYDIFKDASGSDTRTLTTSTVAAS